MEWLSLKRCCNRKYQEMQFCDLCDLKISVGQFIVQTEFRINSAIISR
jgi:hypothetical protein